MQSEWRARLQRWQWLLNYRLAALGRTAKGLLIAALACQGLMLSAIVAQEQQAGELQQQLQRNSQGMVDPGRSLAMRQRQLLDEFNAFLPAADQLPAVAESLHGAATEAGISLDKLSSQALAGQPASIVRRQALHLQASGDQAPVERFILLALLENDALLLRRWAFQADATGTAASTLDFEILVKP